MSDFDINYTSKTTQPFFIITNPKETDTIILRSMGLHHTGMLIEQYLGLMSELYPEEMEKYRMEYLAPAPELTEK
ncbi:hypothetical protein SAMN02927921_01820 [Sinomicrobium oceani]|uniref:Uncharacterized protein n=2 Tax=Sinomicrobium oceani TaxID=1150368 RepID=A0A1K1PLI7_9FLAO|nr:hypothetical protein SAMN02927921_01820 [Sinomicrobium oceani]